MRLLKTFFDKEFWVLVLINVLCLDSFLMGVPIAVIGLLIIHFTLGLDKDYNTLQENLVCIFFLALFFCVLLQ